MSEVIFTRPDANFDRWSAEFAKIVTDTSNLYQESELYFKEDDSGISVFNIDAPEKWGISYPLYVEFNMENIYIEQLELLLDMAISDMSSAFNELDFYDEGAVDWDEGLKMMEEGKIPVGAYVESVGTFFMQELPTTSEYLEEWWDEIDGFVKNSKSKLKSIIRSAHIEGKVIAESIW